MAGAVASRGMREVRCVGRIPDLYSGRFGDIPAQSRVEGEEEPPALGGPAGFVGEAALFACDHIIQHLFGGEGNLCGPLLQVE